MGERGTDNRFDEPGGTVPDDVDVPEVAAAFDLLGDPVRVRILLALAGTRQADWRHDGLSYSTLREAVDVEDGGRFNYHLDRLRDVFVRKKDERYRLTGDGTRLVDVVFGGSLGRSVDRERTTIERSDRAGDGRLEVGFYDGYLAVWQPGADQPIWDMTLPPNAAADRSLEELVDLSSLAARHYTELAVDGTCPECWGRIDRRVEGPDEPVRFECDRCSTTFELHPWCCALVHPEIESVLTDFGYDIDDIFSWWHAAEHFEQRGTDPLSITLTFDDDRRSVSLPSSGPMTVDTDRSNGDSPEGSGANGAGRH